MVCIVCGRPTARTWLCNTCRVPYQRAWIVGERSGVLQRLVGLYKFSRAKAAYRDIGDLLLAILPELPDNTVIVPVPTVSGHIRERGYDHMLLIAKYVEKKRNLKCQRLIGRKTDTKQRQSTAIQRAKQAKSAFEVRGEVDDSKVYLLIDDVVTTGATIKYAAKSLRDAGAKYVWVAVVARQVLK
ncbi:MAG: phosphoribosyltransferase family protein [Candidatus Saccharibacteria bacterium]